jgi:hypothetical protein
MEQGFCAIPAWRSACSAVKFPTVLHIDEVNVTTLENAEIFQIQVGSVLSGEGGSAGCGWRCC